MSSPVFSASGRPFSSFAGSLSTTSASTILEAADAPLLPASFPLPSLGVLLQQLLQVRLDDLLCGNCLAEEDSLAQALQRTQALSAGPGRKAPHEPRHSSV